MLEEQKHKMRWILFWVFVVFFCVITVGTMLLLYTGSGNVMESDRSLLLRVFLIEIGFAVCALFYSLFGIRGKNRSVKNVGGANSKPTETVEASASENGGSFPRLEMPNVQTATLLPQGPQIESKDWSSKYKDAGLIDIVPSMIHGTGSTSEILKKTRINFSFMGIGARKWINTAPLLEERIKSLSRRTGSARFLLLDPNSRNALELSRVNHGNDRHLPDLIEKSIEDLGELIKRGCKIQVKTYSFFPIFRIAIIDNRFAYVGFYRNISSGEETPQLVLDAEAKHTFWQPFSEYFDNVWKHHSKDAYSK